ncbi:MAG: response regulator [Flavobacteriales bacterium]|nr:response regulator [Flavobacteriales bacterium]
MTTPSSVQLDRVNLYDQHSGEKLRILILEDRDSDAAVIKLELRNLKFEHEIKHALTREEFENYLTDFDPQLVLSDYNLPQYTGLEALRYTREKCNYVPFIICTGRVNEETAVECIKAGADDYVLKENLTRLTSACELAIEHKANLLARDRASIELQQSEENFRALTENAPDRVYKITRQGIIEYVNRPFGEYQIQDVIGTSLFNYIHVDDHDKMMLAIEQSWEKQENITLEMGGGEGGPDRQWYLCRIGPVLKGDQVESLILIPSNITAKKKAEIELHELNERLHDLSQHLEHVRDEEKKRISMEIHDQLGQELTGSKLGLFWIKQHFQQNGLEKADLDAVYAKIDYLVDLTTQTIQTVRRIAHELRPVVLDNIGLIPALEWHIENYNQNHETQAHLKIDTGNLIFEKDLATALYRIVQEALTNINRHAQASRADIALYTSQNQLILEIRDNGVGIDVEKASKSKSLGLFGIKERIKKWDGDISIVGSPGKGTEITIKLELEKLKTHTHESSHHL